MHVDVCSVLRFKRDMRTTGMAGQLLLAMSMPTHLIMYSHSLAWWHLHSLQLTCCAGCAEESVIPASHAYIGAAQLVCNSIDRLYDGPMPASTAWF